MKKEKLLFILIGLFILVLSACGPKEDEGAKVLKKVFEAHNEIKSVKVDSAEDGTDGSAEDEYKIDFENGDASIEMKEAMESIFMGESLLLYMRADGTVDEYDPSDEDVASIYERVKNYDNPLVIYTKGEQKMHEAFDLEAEDDTYVLTFSGSDEDKQKIGTAFLHLEGTGSNDPEDMDDSLEDVDIQELDVTIVINRDSHLVQSVDTEIKFEDEDGPTSATIKNQFSEYNKDLLEDDKVDLDDIVTDETVNAMEENESLNKDTKKKLEEEATAYVDALIQATVFQNEKEFIKKAPKSMDKKAVESEANTQKEFFKEIYTENTKQNMAGTGATDEDIAALADAFMDALGTTKYEMGNAIATSETEIVVTVSVEGIDDQAIYEDTERQMNDIMQKGEITEEAEAISKNLEILANQYKKVDSLTDASELDVHVTYNDGKYIVLVQDEYLAGFVQ